MAPASAQLRVRPERKDGGHPAFCNAPPQWLRMRHQSHQSPRNFLDEFFAQRDQTFASKYAWRAQHAAHCLQLPVACCTPPAPCLFSILRAMLPAACCVCILHSASCRLHAACCASACCVLCCGLHVICCFLFLASCFSHVCCMSYAVCSFLCAACCLLLAACWVLLAACCLREILSCTWKAVRSVVIAAVRSAP